MMFANKQNIVYFVYNMSKIISFQAYNMRKNRGVISPSVIRDDSTASAAEDGDAAASPDKHFL